MHITNITIVNRDLHSLTIFITSVYCILKNIQTPQKRAARRIASDTARSG